MFIENEIEYKDCADYAARNEELTWHGEEDNQKALNGYYLITETKSRGVWATAGSLTCTFASIGEAQAAAQKNYKRRDWTTGKGLI